MAKSNNKIKRGFTIIEVVLVLAIAGLIFLMVFVGFPALQRSQRDTQRRNDVSRMISQLSSYQTNNGGASPSGGGGIVLNADPEYRTASEDWANFMKNYMKRITQDGAKDGPTDATSEFKDPLTNDNYNYYVYNCGSSSYKNADGSCKYPPSSYKKTNTMYINKQAVCDGEISKYEAGERNISVTIILEGGGRYCQNT